MKYQEENKAKADFNKVYGSLTPHSYIKEMDRHNYRIGDETQPFFTAAAEYIHELNGTAWPVQMLDVGCSYGIGSATVRYGCTFQEMVSFFSSRAPENYRTCCETTRMWLNVVQPPMNLRCVGLDCSENAINFAMDAGILDAGISANLEKNEKDKLTEDDLSWIRTSNLLVSSGAIGYVTEKTLSVLLDQFGKDHPGEYGPFAVISILRMFNTENIEEVFRENGFKFGKVDGIFLRQRRFTDAEEKRSITEILRKKGKSTAGLEDEGILIAELYAAAKPEQFDDLFEVLKSTKPVTKIVRNEKRKIAVV